MPQDAQTFCFLYLVTIGAIQEVAGYVVPIVAIAPKIPEMLLHEAGQRAFHFGIQYGTIAIGQAVAGDGINTIDVNAPLVLAKHGMESLASASSPAEAATRGTIALATIVLSGVSTGDPNVSMAFGSFIVVLCQQILFPGAQCTLVVNGLYLPLLIVRTVAVPLILEVQVEFLCRKYKLPRKFPKFRDIFKRKKNEQLICYYVPTIKKKEFTFLSREFSVYFPSPKKRTLKFKSKPMVEPIFL